MRKNRSWVFSSEHPSFEALPANASGVRRGGVFQDPASFAANNKFQARLLECLRPNRSHLFSAVADLHSGRRRITKHVNRAARQPVARPNRESSMVLSPPPSSESKTPNRLCRKPFFSLLLRPRPVVLEKKVFNFNVVPNCSQTRVLAREKMSPFSFLPDGAGRSGHGTPAKPET